MKRKRAAILLTCLLACAAAAVRGEGTARAAGALSTAADAAVKALGTLPPEAIVVAGPLVSDAPLVRGDELAVRVAAIVAARIGGAARPHDAAVKLAAAQSLARSRGALVFVQTAIAKGEVRLTVDVYPIPKNAWDRVRMPAPPARGHGFASAPLDAEVRSFLPPILLEQAKVRAAKHDEGEVLAAACGDLDGDGGMELALVSRTRVALGRVRGNAFVPGKVAPWSSLATRLPVPMREPLAGVVFGPRGPSGRLLYVGTTERGGVALDADLKVRLQLRGVPVPLAVASADFDACASPNAEQAAFDGPVTGCAVAVRDPLVRLEPPAARFDGFAAAEITSKDGAAVTLVAAREPSGKLRLKLGDRDLRVLDEAGAQVAVGDLDLDGVPEVVSSADAGDDFVAVQSVTGSDLKMRLRIPAPAGVRALAVCPPEERGAPVLVAVVGSEVWLVR